MSHRRNFIFIFFKLREYAKLNSYRFKEVPLFYLWFNDESSDNRTLFYRHLNLFRGNKSDENRVNLVHARSEYMTSLRNARFHYDKQQTEKLNKLRYKNARDYLKLFKNAPNAGRPNVILKL